MCLKYIAVSLMYYDGAAEQLLLAACCLELDLSPYQAPFALLFKTSRLK